MKVLNTMAAATLMIVSVLAASAQNKPNIIFVMADDLGYAQLGCYGQEKIKTPRIDQLARQGMRFTNFYAGNTVCAPSRASLVTGQHPGHAYVRNNYEIGAKDSYLGQLPLPAEEVTFFEILQQAGYQTGCFGKWGLGRAESEGDPNRQGVDEFFGYNCQRQAHSYYPYYLEGNRGAKIMLDGNTRQPGGPHYSHSLIVDRSLDFVRKNKDTPFFLYLPVCIPHYDNEIPDQGIYRDKEWEEYKRIQAAMITRLDTDVGRLVDLLEELKIDDNTLVIFTSDNGGHNGRKGDNVGYFFETNGALRGFKGELYEGGLRVPFVARWPGKIRAGATSEHIAAFWDVLPTFAAIADQPVPEACDGVSFLPELLGEEQPPHPHLYWEFYGYGGWRALRQGPWKAVQKGLHQNANAPIELYNLEADVGETTDLAGKHPELVQELANLMKTEHTPSEIFQFKH